MNEGRILKIGRDNARESQEQSRFSIGIAIIARLFALFRQAGDRRFAKGQNDAGQLPVWSGRKGQIGTYLANPGQGQSRSVKPI